VKRLQIRQNVYLNNRVEHDHRAVKRRVGPMLGFKSLASARAILGRIEVIHMMRKGQAKYVCHWQPLPAEQYDLLAA
jgi:putative transposase